MAVCSPKWPKSSGSRGNNRGIGPTVRVSEVITKGSPAKLNFQLLHNVTCEFRLRIELSYE